MVGEGGGAESVHAGVWRGSLFEVLLLYHKQKPEQAGRQQGVGRVQ